MLQWHTSFHMSTGCYLLIYCWYKILSSRTMYSSHVVFFLHDHFCYEELNMGMNARWQCCIPAFRCSVWLLAHAGTSRWLWFQRDWQNFVENDAVQSETVVDLIKIDVTELNWRIRHNNKEERVKFSGVSKMFVCFLYHAVVEWVEMIIWSFCKIKRKKIKSSN